jgi:hypothetical protein
LPSSDAGPATMLRIFEGAFTGWWSGIIDPAREGVADMPDTAREVLDLPDPLPSNGADIEPLTFDIAILSGSAFLCVAAVETMGGAFENSDSLSPTHDLANHRPPAMPRISRFAVLQRRTLVPLLSRGNMGAKPVPIFGGGCTGNGLEGRG